MSGRWVSFIGKSGTGKTMLAKATVAGIRQPMPIFREWSAVCNWLARGEWDITGLLKFQPVLILDEITQPYDSDELSKFDLKTKKALFEIISARVGRWTIITDNKTLREISQFETRIASRMLRPGADGRPSVVCEFRECPDFWAARRVRA
jgi:DNA replication protein DnaC